MPHPSSNTHANRHPSPAPRRRTSHPLRAVTVALALSHWTAPQQSHAACSQASPKASKTITGCLDVAGNERAYRLFVPTSYPGGKTTLPLIVGLHGGGDKPKAFERYSRFSKLSESTGEFIVVYPEGIGGHWNDGRENVGEEADDMAFLAALPIHLSQSVGLRIDPRKVFVAGMSNGGLMAARVACERPDWVAGVGVVGAAISLPMATNCTDGKPLPIAFVFGRNDTSFLKDGRQVNPVKPSQSRGRHIGIGPSIDLWHKRNRCTGSIDSKGPTDRHRNRFGPKKDDHTRVFIHRHEGCESPLLWIDIEGGGHRWPDPTALNGPLLVDKLGLGWASHEISTAARLWEFFAAIDAPEPRKR